MRVPSEGDLVGLEKLVDIIGLYEATALLAAICVSKAAEAENSDAILARWWNRAGEAISAAGDSEAVGMVSL